MFVIRYVEKPERSFSIYVIGETKKSIEKKNERKRKVGAH
jgi:hypothetical protein